MDTTIKTYYMLSNLTITIPTYNRNGYLLKLFKSIPSDFNGKVVISDNGSFVSDEIKENHKNYKFISISEKIDMFENWNVALNNVDTEWFVLPSDDDIFLPDSMEKINVVLNQHPLADIIVFGHNVIDENGSYISSWRPKEDLVFQAPDGFKIFSKGVEARCPSIIFRTEFAKKMGGFDISFDYTGADSLLIQKCLLYGTSVFSSKVISAYRSWPNSFTSQFAGTKDWLEKIEKWTKEIDRLIKKDFSNNSPIRNLKNYKDEILARNILAGLVNKRKNDGIIAALRFAFEYRLPIYADFITKLRIIKVIIWG